MTTSRTGLGALLAFSLLAAACGGGSGDDDPPLGSDPFPLAVGNTWDMEHSERNSVVRMTTRVTGTSVIDGSPAFVVESFDGPSGKQYFQRTGTEVIRAVNPESSPYQQRIGPIVMLKLPLRVGDRWTALDKVVDTDYDSDGDGVLDPVELYTEMSVIRTESVTTPARRFDTAYVVGEYHQWAYLRKDGGPLLYGYSTTLQWIVHGVGVVKRETSVTPPDGPFSRQTSDSLQDFDVAPN